MEEACQEFIETFIPTSKMDWAGLWQNETAKHIYIYI